MKKTVQVVILPMDKVVFPNITKNPHTDKLFFNERGLVKGMGFSYNHLYFTSNEEIKDGDYFEVGGIIRKTKDYRDYTNIKGNVVIATTDKSLNLPLIPQSFIEEYVNFNGGISEVEYDTETGEIVAEDAIYLKPKKQTLEEEAEERYPEYYEDFEKRRSDFIAGAKWQQSNS